MASPIDAGQRSRPSRREFLKASTAAATLASLPVAHSAHAAGSDTLKLGLIGCGGRGSGAALQAMNADPGAKLVAMADIFESRLRASRKNLKQRKPQQTGVDDEHCFVGFDAYRKVIDSDVDVVLIACTSRFHAEYLTAAIAAGKHVFVEKPHAIDPPGVRMVLAAAEEAKRKNLAIVSGLEMRYDFAAREIIGRVFDGAIGDIVSIELTFMRNPYRILQRNPNWTEIEWQYRNWYHFRWLSGDDVPQSLLHMIDTAAWAMHEKTPSRAFGLGGRSSCFGPKFGDCFDHASIVYEYADGLRMHGYDRTQLGCFGDRTARFVGTKGRCLFFNRPGGVDGRIEGQTNWRYQGSHVGGHQMEQQELLASIRNGKPINDGQRMARSTMAAVLGQFACYTGKQLEWEETLHSDFAYGPRECDFTTNPPVKPDDRGVYPVPVPGMTKLAERA